MIWKSKLNRNVKWAWTILLIFFSCLIGLSRIYLNVHYASDVLVGYITGFLWLLIALEVLEKIENSNKEKWLIIDY